MATVFARSTRPRPRWAGVGDALQSDVGASVALAGRDYTARTIMEAIIRRAHVGDVEQLVRLNGIVQQLHVDARPDTFGPPSAEAVAAWFTARLADPNARVWIAEIEGRAVGYVLAMFMVREASAFLRARSWCEVDQLAVDPTARRRGVARALVAALAQEAQAVGVTELKAQTWGFNEPSRRLFESLGFEVENVRFRRSARSE